MYDVKTLCQRANISQQTFYRLLKDNKEFRDVAESGRKKRGNSYQYTDDALKWLISYYASPDTMAEEKTEAKNEIAENAPKIASEPSEDDGRQKPLLDEINALNQKIDALQKALDDKEQERKALFIQNGQLLFLLSQEKQEKQALLPSPKKPLVDRIKGIFQKEKQPEN